MEGFGVGQGWQRRARAGKVMVGGRREVSAVGKERQVCSWAAGDW